MDKPLRIKKIEKYEEQKVESIRKLVRNTNFLAFFGILIFASIKNGCDTEAEQLIIGGSVAFGTINVITIVKSICKIYSIKGKEKELENENKQK